MEKPSFSDEVRPELTPTEVRAYQEIISRIVAEKPGKNGIEKIVA